MIITLSESEAGLGLVWLQLLEKYHMRPITIMIKISGTTQLLRLIGSSDEEINSGAGGCTVEAVDELNPKVLARGDNPAGIACIM